MLGTAGLLKDLFRRRISRIAGISWKGSMLVVAGLSCLDSGDWELSFLEESLIPDRSDHALQEIADKVYLCLSSRGWEGALLVIDLQESGYWLETCTLPSLAKEKEMRETVRFELSSREIFSGAPFRFAYMPVPGQEGTYHILAVEERVIEEWRQRFHAAGLELSAISVLPPEISFRCTANFISWEGGRITAASPLLDEHGNICRWNRQASGPIYGALVLAGRVPAAQLVIHISEASACGFDVSRICKVILGTFCFILLLISCYDFGRLYKLHSEEAKARAELSLIYQDQQRMEDYMEKDRWIAQRDALLDRLSQESIPALSVLIHLGTKNVNGVYLTGMTLDTDQHLLLSGKADSFESLAEYMHKYEEDIDSFPRGPVLRESKVKDEGKEVEFVLELVLEGE